MRRLRVPASLLCVLGLILLSAVEATAAGKKRIFVTKTDEKFVGQAGVTFELYQDTDGDGTRDDGEPLLQTKVTDATGKATFDPVDPGKYVVHEVTPAGYKDQPDTATEVPNAKGPGPQIVYQNEPKPTNHRVNDPTGDTSVDDGTHVFDFTPSMAIACDEEQLGSVASGPDPCPDPEVLVGWNHSAGFGLPNRSLVTTARSTDAGNLWGDYAEPPTGPNAFILGQPSVIYDPVRNRFVIATDAIVNTPGGLRHPIFVSTSGGPFGFWGDPVNTFPTIAPEPALAHGASLAVDPIDGTVYLGFTRSNGDDTSDAMFSRSTDGGLTWSPPVSLSGTGTFDHVDVEAGPNDRVYVAWSDFGGPGGFTYDVDFRRSINAGQSFSAMTPILEDLPKAGTPGTCTGSATGRTVLGSAAVFDEGSLSLNPRNINRLLFAFAIHGQGNDESDVNLIRSNDGGATWTGRRSLETSGTQFAPQIAFAPDGRAAVTYYDSPEDPLIDPLAQYVDPFGYSFVGEPESLTDGNPFPLWNIDPSFDTHYNNCFGLGGPAVVAPGSGFFFAWADGRDPGPAGNNGIDPNIYFANDIGPFLDTTTTALISKTPSTIKVKGAVAPPPLAGARVSVTLFVNGDKLGKKRPATDKSGAWSTSFARPPAGSCRIEVVFEGSEGREPSPTVTKTFAC